MASFYDEGNVLGGTVPVPGIGGTDGGFSNNAFTPKGSEYNITKNTYDPTSQFVNNLIQQILSQRGAVSPTVTAGIENMITNPGAVGDVAGSQFRNIAAPLLEQQARGFKVGDQQLQDQFRKAGVGSMQSGAFAQALRQRASDKDLAQQTLLASNYIPLTSQLSSNVLGGINAGLEVPRAELGTLAGILGTLQSRPLTTEQAGTSLVPQAPGTPGMFQPGANKTNSIWGSY